MVVDVVVLVLNSVAVDLAVLKVVVVLNAVLVFLLSVVLLAVL